MLRLAWHIRPIRFENSIRNLIGRPIRFEIRFVRKTTIRRFLICPLPAGPAGASQPFLDVTRNNAINTLSLQTSTSSFITPLPATRHLKSALFAFVIHFAPGAFCHNVTDLVRRSGGWPVIIMHFVWTWALSYHAVYCWFNTLSDNSVMNF